MGQREYILTKKNMSKALHKMKNFYLDIAQSYNDNHLLNNFTENYHCLIEILQTFCSYTMRLSNLTFKHLIEHDHHKIHKHRN